jgi:hypothetical protein
MKEKMEKEKEGDNYVEKENPRDLIEGEDEDKEETAIETLDKFLSCFVWAGDSGKKIDQIDIILALKSLPEKVDESNLARCDLFNFESTSTSIIAFNNNDQDELFKYYDNRNKKRLNKL